MTETALSLTNLTTAELLERLQQALQALLHLLPQERDAIVHHQHQRVAELTQHKSQLLDDVQVLDNLLKTPAHAEQLAQQHSEALANIDAQLEQLKHDSQVNAQLVDVTLSRIEKLRELIIRTHNNDQVTYNDKGRIR